MILFHGKTVHPASFFRKGQLTTHNPKKGCVDIYRADGDRWVLVANWDSTLCKYLDLAGNTFNVEEQRHD